VFKLGIKPERKNGTLWLLYCVGNDAVHRSLKVRRNQSCGRACVFFRSAMNCVDLSCGKESCAIAVDQKTFAALQQQGFEVGTLAL